jgi:N-acetylneuraminate synthase/N,N'-diacetyllegionaminate synthase
VNTVVGVILARAGSKGLPGKCMRELLGRPLISYTMDHALASRRLTAVAVSTDSEDAKALARQRGLDVIDRPPPLATDEATVDAAARHAVECWEDRHGKPVDLVVLLYGNIPIRAEGLIDRAVEHLITTGADSVRSVAPVTKQHPDWVHRLEGDRIRQYRPNSIYRRQDLEPLYYHDGAVAAVTRTALFRALKTPEDGQAFLGADRRAIVQGCDEAVDVDEPADLLMAEALLRATRSTEFASPRSKQPPVGHVTVGQNTVGMNHPAFIIAEAGVNHDGSIEQALRLVDAAVDAGADAVKFQLFTAADLVVEGGAAARYQHAGCGETSQHAMLSPLELPESAYRQMKTYCDERSIQFLATPFGEKEVDRLVRLGAPAVKIASTDLTNHRLLTHAAASGLPMIVSTGASTDAEISAAVETLRRAGSADRLILLHCVSCYPAPLDAMNLRAIETLRLVHCVPTGLSDHTTSTQVGAWAVAAGACVLEKHFTLDPAAPGPDHAMSMSPTGLAEYVRAVREVERALGEGSMGMHRAEGEVRAVARKSVVASRTIRSGTRLTADMLTLKRPGTGLDPGAIDRLVDRTAAVDIPRDTLLSWDMVR